MVSAGEAGGVPSPATTSPTRTVPLARMAAAQSAPAQLTRPAATLHVMPQADETERACGSAQLSFHPVTAPAGALTSMSAT